MDQQSKSRSDEGKLRDKGEMIRGKVTVGKRSLLKEDLGGRIGLEVTLKLEETTREPDVIQDPDEITARIGKRRFSYHRIRRFEVEGMRGRGKGISSIRKGLPIGMRRRNGSGLEKVVNSTRRNTVKISRQYQRC